MDWIEALLLGALQGLTEFLPVSSDGHLAVTQNLFDAIRGHPSTAAEKLFFDVLLHLGTLLAIVVYYRKSIASGVRGFLGATDVPPVFQRKALLRIAILVFVASLPLVPYALGLKKVVEGTFQSLTAAGVGFLITATVLALTPFIPRRDKGPEETRWFHALAIGIAQAFAPLPGVSRSGLTVAAGLACGLSPTWSVGFSFLIAVPAIAAANLLELKDADLGALSASRVAQIIAAMVVAGVLGYLALAWLVRIVVKRRLWVFSLYLFALGTAVIIFALARPPRSAGDGMGGPASSIDHSRRAAGAAAPPRAEAVAVEELARAYVSQRRWRSAIPSMW
jgi:undecaprenyl-diphosphatase